MTSVDDLLGGSGLPATEARALLCLVLGVERAWIIAHGRDCVSSADAQKAEALFARRRAGEPIAYLTGKREFCGLSLRVTPDVLIPRPETEMVVEQALAAIAGRRTPRVLDLGTGSGAIAVSIAHERPDAEVWASDTSPAALGIARDNAARQARSVRFVESDWFGSFGDERFDVIASNPPYVASGDPHLEQGDVRFEPKSALDGGPDGLECIRRIAAEARTHLASGGWLVFEHGYDQGPACVRLLAGLGYSGVSNARDLAGLPRVCRGRFDLPRSVG